MGNPEQNYISPLYGVGTDQMETFTRPGRCSDIVPLGVPHTTMQVCSTLVHLLHLSNLLHFGNLSVSHRGCDYGDTEVF